MQKILLDDVGLTYICATADRFFAVSTVLGNMVRSMVESPSHRLLKHIIRCYLRLADNPRARDALRQCLPEELRDNTFANTIKVDQAAIRWLQQLMRNVYPDTTTPGGAPSSGGAALGGVPLLPPPGTSSGMLLPGFSS